MYVANDGLLPKRRVRVERGMYRQPSGKYAVCFMLDGRPRSHSFGSSSSVFDYIRRKREARSDEVLEVTANEYVPPAASRRHVRTVVHGEVLACRDQNGLLGKLGVDAHEPLTTGSEDQPAQAPGALDVFPATRGYVPDLIHREIERRVFDVLGANQAGGRFVHGVILVSRSEPHARIKQMTHLVVRMPRTSAAARPP